MVVDNGALYDQCQLCLWGHALGSRISDLGVTVSSEACVTCEPALCVCPTNKMEPCVCVCELLNCNDSDIEGPLSDTAHRGRSLARASSPQAHIRYTPIYDTHLLRSASACRAQRLSRAAPVRPVVPHCRRRVLRSRAPLCPLAPQMASGEVQKDRRIRFQTQNCCRSWKSALLDSLCAL